MFWIPAEEGNGTSRCEKCYKEDFNKVRTSNSGVAEMPFKNALQEKWNNFFSCSFACFPLFQKKRTKYNAEFCWGKIKTQGSPFLKSGLYKWVFQFDREGEGGQKLIGRCPHSRSTFQKDASLTSLWTKCWLFQWILQHHQILSLHPFHTKGHIQNDSTISFSLFKTPAGCSTRWK